MQAFPWPCQNTKLETEVFGKVDLAVVVKRIWRSGAVSAQGADGGGSVV